jgi:hypothetical protein
MFLVGSPDRIWAQGNYVITATYEFDRSRKKRSAGQATLAVKPSEGVDAPLRPPPQ